MTRTGSENEHGDARREIFARHGKHPPRHLHFNIQHELSLGRGSSPLQSRELITSPDPLDSRRGMDDYQGEVAAKCWLHCKPHESSLMIDKRFERAKGQ